MKAGTVVGIILVIIGVVSLAYQGITYTTRETKVDLGPVEIVDEDRRTIPLPPILGAVALVGGIALVAFSAKSHGG